MSSMCKMFCSLLDWDAVGRRGGGGRVGGIVDTAFKGGIAFFFYFLIFIYFWVAYATSPTRFRFFFHFFL